MTTEDNTQRVEEIKERIEELIEIIDRLDSGDYDHNETEEYDEALDEQGDITIGSLRYSPSHVLETVDPTAYRVGMDEYFSSRIEDYRDELTELKEELAELGGTEE